jgi:NAD(P)-dependent dehydrogenase (short-subunit alcohol dehydrogenase family)
LNSADRKVALVSGCSTGIGLFVAKRFAEMGVLVVAGARKPSALADLAAERPGLVHPIEWDVNDAEGTRRAITTTIERFGRIDILVNNAGYGQFGPLIELSREQWRSQLETNVVGLADAASWAARAPGGMIERRSGRIVNIGSIVGRVAIPLSGAYCATKHAVEAISDALRMELAPFGIDVVCVEPGPVKSAFSENAKKTIADVMARRDSPYDYLREAIRSRLNTAEEMGNPTSKCADVIVRVSTMSRPPTRITVTPQARLLVWIRRLLSDRLLDGILKRRYGLAQPAPAPRGVIKDRASASKREA